MKKKMKALSKSIGTFVMTAAMVLGTISLPSAAAEPLEFRWLGRDGSSHVDTGLGNGTEDRWYVLTDKNDRGTSRLILSGNTDPVEFGDYISDEDVKKSGGISGTATLGEGYDYPYLYVGFYIVGLNDDPKPKPVVTDVTGWGGISIAYESDKKIALELSMGEDGDKNELEFDCPKVYLDKTDGKCKVASFAWEDFKQGGWGEEKPIEDVVQSLAAIRIKIEGVAGTVCNFKIAGIGSKDADLSGNYIVTFDTNGGSEVAAQSVEPGQKAAKPADPTKSGFTFAGWYTDSTLTTLFDFDSAINKDTTIYAKWNDPSAPTPTPTPAPASDTHTVTFITNGGSKVAAQKVAHGKKVTYPDEPTKEGYKFEGWYSDSALTKPFEFNDPINDDIMIYAKWSKASDEPAAVGTKLVDEAGEANYVVLSAGKTDASDASKNEMPTVEYSGTTNKNVKKIIVPDTVKCNGVVYNVESISADALKNNKKLISVTIGKNVKEIKKNAFAGCTSLKTVNCKSKVLAKIGANAFKGDKKLTKITLKTTLLKKSKVGSNAIKGTSKKLKISAPKKVRKSYQKIFKAKGNKKVKVK